MRMALSCNHDNSKFFEQCCEPDLRDPANLMAPTVGEIGAACNSSDNCADGLTCLEKAELENARNRRCMSAMRWLRVCVGSESQGSCQTGRDTRRKVYNQAANQMSNRSFFVQTAYWSLFSH